MLSGTFVVAVSTYTHIAPIFGLPALSDPNLPTPLTTHSPYN